MFGEKGLVLVRCMNKRGYRERGCKTDEMYRFEYNDTQYVDARDLPGFPRDKFEKVKR